MDYLKPIKEYVPQDIQEKKDIEQILKYEKITGNLLTRDNTIAHITVSSIILNKTRDKLLMIYHNIWQDWCWTGGHADGETDFLQVALKEAKEETGVEKVFPVVEQVVSIDIIPAWGHFKEGKYVVAHQHVNLTYVLEIDENQTLHINENETQGVKWFSIKEYKKYAKQKSMHAIYDKVLEKFV